MYKRWESCYAGPREQRGGFYMLDKFFKISERGSTVSNEVIGGLTTFLAMAYIIAVNPAMMEAAGIPFNAALTATLLRRRRHDGRRWACSRTVPSRSRPGMGINAIVAYHAVRVGLGVRLARRPWAWCSWKASSSCCWCWACARPSWMPSPWRCSQRHRHRHRPVRARSSG